MSERNGKRRIYRFLIGAVLAGELTVLTDIAVVLLGWSLPVSAFLLIAAGLTLCFYVFDRFTRKNLTVTAFSVFGVLAAAITAGVLLWQQFGTWAAYNPVDSGKAELYADREVMLIVPHQDDDLNVLGGVMEEYVRYGSQVYPVFVTNGDYYDLAETRFRETLDVCAYVGIPEENVFFLGYGDTWAEGGPHLYNAEPGTVLSSYNGKTETYSTAAHSVFREGRAYTVENLLEDLEAVILSQKPDVIFCSDYDSHIDHKAVTLAFEKVMGKILKEHPDYRPEVFKGYAYKSAWYAQPDYYEVNILSTENVFEEPHYQYPRNYLWEDRVRLPIDGGILSRSLLQSKAYETILLYISQEAQLHAASVYNGDKIFWYRDTDSLCYGADILTSSGNKAVLNDFMLLENNNLVDSEYPPYDGVWIPEAGDQDRAAEVILETPSDIYSIVLYDHPAEEQNVLDAVIVFDDGTQVRTGALHKGGAATEILVEKTNVSSFRVCLVTTEGTEAGLAEIEAFTQKPAADMKFLKTMDKAGNFVYDYWVPKDGKIALDFYAYGEIPAVSEENYQVTSDNAECSARISDGQLVVSCPSGQTATVTVSSKDGTVSDSIFVQNPKWADRIQCKLCQGVEELLFVGYYEGRYWQLATVKVLGVLQDLVETVMK